MLAKTAEWVKNNKLTLHLGKTKAQLIGSYRRVTKNTKITVKFNDQIIEQVHSAKLLGIHILHGKNTITVYVRKYHRK